MRIAKYDYLYGPNIYDDRPGFWLDLELGQLEGRSSAGLGAGFRDGLLNLFTGLREGVTAAGRPFAEALEDGDGLPFEEVFAGAFLALERMVGFAASWSHCLDLDVPGVRRLIMECPVPEAAPVLAQFTFSMLNNLLPHGLRNPELLAPPGTDLRRELAQFLGAARGWVLEPTAQATVDEATRRGIPWKRLGLASPFVQLGHGHRGIRLHGTASDRDGVIARESVRDLSVSRQLLAAAGLPVPTSYRVSNPHEAQAAAAALGYPVLLEPPFQDAGDPLRANDAAGLQAALGILFSRQPALLVTRPIEGQRLRLLVIGGRLAAATTDAEPPADLTAALHPDNRALAETAAAQFRLTACEVRLTIGDPTRSWREVPAGITALAYPADFAFHQRANPQHELAARFVESLFPAPDTGRVPVTAITGSAGKTSTTQMLSHILRHAGRVCGTATSQGLFVDGRLVVHDERPGGPQYELTLDPRVDTLVLENARGALLTYGLASGYCDTGAVLAITDDHVGWNGVRDIEELARIKRLVAEHCRGTLVLDADDPRCLAMRAHSPAARFCLVSKEEENAALAAHVRQGGPGFRLAGGAETIELWLDDGWHPLLAAAEIPATYGGAARANAINATFAAALAWSQGIPPATIAEALRGFAASLESNPGRLNVIDELPFRVVIDFAHSPEKWSSTADFVERLEVTGRRLLMLASSGQRSDEVMHAIAGACASGFDHYVLARRNKSTRRGEFGAQQFFAEALQAHGVSATAISISGDESAAIDQILAMARPGDVVVVGVNEWQDCVERIRLFAAQRAAAAGEADSACVHGNPG